MNIIAYVAVLIAALISKTGTFSFYLGSKKYIVVVSEVEHTMPLGKFSLRAAVAFAKAVSSGGVVGTYTVRVGADDYSLSVTAV